LLDVIFTNKEGPIGHVKVRRSFGCSDHEMVESRSLRGGSRVRNRITALDFRKAVFGLLRDLFGRSTWYSMVLERRAVREIFKGRLLQALIWSIPTSRQPA